jgi:hypothetical protein
MENDSSKAKTAAGFNFTTSTLGVIARRCI